MYHDHVKDVLYFSEPRRARRQKTCTRRQVPLPPIYPPGVCCGHVGVAGRSTTATQLQVLHGNAHWGGGLIASSLLSLSGEEGSTHPLSSLSLSLQSRVPSAPWFSRTAWRRCATTHGATALQPRPTARARTRAPTRSPVTWGAGMWAMRVPFLYSATARTAPLGYPCMHARAMHMHAGAIVAILVVSGGA